MTNKDKELMRLYGEFLTRFEFVCSRLRFAINHLLYSDYDISKRNICEIMTEGLTADPLRKKFVALIIERYKKDSDLHKSAKLVSKFFLNIIELRNSFAHGTPFFGEHDFIEETKKARLVLRHPKIKTDGLDLNFKIFDSKTLKEIIDSLIKIERAISFITILIKGKNQGVKEEVKVKFHYKIKTDLETIEIKKLILSSSS